jgi:hypothetical protein
MRTKKIVPQEKIEDDKIWKKEKCLNTCFREAKAGVFDLPIKEFFSRSSRTLNGPL